MKFLKFLTLLDNSLIRNVDAAVKLRKESTHKFFVGLKVVLLKQIFEIIEEIVEDLDADHIPKARLYLVEEGVVFDDHVDDFASRTALKNGGLPAQIVQKSEDAGIKIDARGALGAGGRAVCR